MFSITVYTARWSRPLILWRSFTLDRLRITLSNRDRTRPYETFNITIKNLHITKLFNFFFIFYIHSRCISKQSFDFFIISIYVKGVHYKIFAFSSTNLHVKRPIVKSLIHRSFYSYSHSQLKINTLNIIKVKPCCHIRILLALNEKKQAQITWSLLVLRLHRKSNFPRSVGPLLPASMEQSNSTFSCLAAFTTLTVSELTQKGTAEKNLIVITTTLGCLKIRLSCFQL